MGSTLKDGGQLEKNNNMLKNHKLKAIKFVKLD
jgi:hypothetical protein